MTKHSVTLEIVIDRDEFISNNTQTITLGYTDIEFSELSVSTNDNMEGYLYGFISNIGFENADNTVITLYRMQNDAKVEISKTNIGEVEANSKQAFSIRIPDDMLMTSTADVMNGLYLNVSTDSDEVKVSNNDDKIVFGTLLTGIYDTHLYYLYGNGELRFYGEGILHYYDTEDNPLNLYGDLIETIALEDTITCEHCYDGCSIDVMPTATQYGTIHHICKMCFQEETVTDIPYLFISNISTVDNKLQITVSNKFFEHSIYRNPFISISIGDISYSINDYSIEDDSLLFEFDIGDSNNSIDTANITLFADIDGVSFESNVEEYLFKQPILGDVDGDGYITVKDSKLLTKYLLGIVSEDDIYMMNADIDSDDFISTKDSKALKNIILNE